MKKIILFTIIINLIYSTNYLSKGLLKFKSLNSKFLSSLDQPTFSYNNYFTQSQGPKNPHLNIETTKIRSFTKNLNPSIPKTKSNKESIDLRSKTLKALNNPKNLIYNLKSISTRSPLKNISSSFSSIKNKLFPPSMKKQSEMISTINSEMEKLKVTLKNSKNYFEIINKIIVAIMILYWSRKERNNTINNAIKENERNNTINYYTEEEANKIINNTIKETQNNLIGILNTNILNIIQDTKIKEQLNLHFKKIVEKHTKTLLNSLKKNILEKDIEEVINQNIIIEEKLKENLLKLTKKTINSLENNFYNMYHEAGHALMQAIQEDYKYIIHIRGRDIERETFGTLVLSSHFLSIHMLLSGLIQEQIFGDVPKMTIDEFKKFIYVDIDKNNPYYEKLMNIRLHTDSDLYHIYDKNPHLNPEEIINKTYKAYEESFVLFEPYQKIINTIAQLTSTRELKNKLTNNKITIPHNENFLIVMEDKEIYEIIESFWSLEQLKTIKEYQK